MTSPPKIPELGEVSSEPDKYTRKSPDMTGASAENRVMLIDVGFFKYGTDDKAHAGAIFLSLLLLFVLFVTVAVGAFAPNVEWLKVAIQVVGSSFTLVAGVAIGRGGAVNKTDPD